MHLDVINERLSERFIVHGIWKSIGAGHGTVRDENFAAFQASFIVGQQTAFRFGESGKFVREAGRR